MRNTSADTLQLVAQLIDVVLIRLHQTFTMQAAAPPQIEQQSELQVGLHPSELRMCQRPEGSEDAPACSRRRQHSHVHTVLSDATSVTDAAQLQSPRPVGGI